MEWWDRAAPGRALRRGAVARICNDRKGVILTLLVILILLALIFGVGAVLKGILWVLVIAAALVIAAIYLGYRRFRGSS